MGPNKQARDVFFLVESLRIRKGVPGTATVRREKQGGIDLREENQSSESCKIIPGNLNLA
jgi:hypothetical protein